LINYSTLLFNGFGWLLLGIGGSMTAWSFSDLHPVTERLADLSTAEESDGLEDSLKPVGDEALSLGEIQRRQLNDLLRGTTSE
jgi:hypothetical protein